jgi:minor extracellular serine protease Vpr
MLRRRSLTGLLVILVLFVWQPAKGQFVPIPDGATDIPTVSASRIATVLSVDEVAKLHPSLQAFVAQARLEPGGPDYLHDVIIRTNRPDEVRAHGVHLNSVYKGFVTARMYTAQLGRVANTSSVTGIDPGTLNFPEGDISVVSTGAAMLHAGWLDNRAVKGRGVIVVVYDTGIDWRHLDFRMPDDTLKTRILAIWDQTLTPTVGERSPAQMSYGVEYTREEIEDALAGRRPALRTQDTNGHGTHVAGSAVGNDLRYHGIAPEAHLVVVKGGDNSFSETRMIDGLTYAQRVAARNNMPVVVNWSIGGRTGPRDGTREYEVAVDQFSERPGHVVVVAAGNDGARNHHRSGQVSQDGQVTVEVNVPLYTPSAGRNNDVFTLDFWIQTAASASVVLTAPDGRIIDAGTIGTTMPGTAGFVRVINQVAERSGHRNVNIRVFDDAEGEAPMIGTWTITLSTTPPGVPFDVWLAEWTLGGNVAAQLVGGTTESSVTMPGTAREAITVASHATRWFWPSAAGLAYTYSNTFFGLDDRSSFSGKGPTRDGRLKPDISAPGQGIFAAISSTSEVGATRVAPGGRHHLSQGTSMAAPHVAGAVALLLSLNANLTAPGIKDLLQTTARTDVFTGAVPNLSWGFGKMDVFQAALRAVGRTDSGREVTWRRTATAQGEIVVTQGQDVAIRFEAAAGAAPSGLLFETAHPNRRPIVGNGRLRVQMHRDENGRPGQTLGGPVFTSLNSMVPYSVSYVPLREAGVHLASAENVFFVLSMEQTTDTLRIRANEGSASHTLVRTAQGAFTATTSGDARAGMEWAANWDPREVGPLPVIVETLSLSRPFPHPFSSITTMHLLSPEDGRAVVTVYDMLGRRVAILYDRIVSSGVTTAIEIINADWPAGMYMVRAEVGGMTVTQRIVKAR